VTTSLGSPEALRSFVEETRLRLRAIRPLRFLGRPGSDLLDVEAIHGIFRQIHSLKSAANLLGLTAVEQLCHRFEDILAGYRDGEMTPGAGSEAELEPTLDAIERLVDHIRIIRAIDVSEELARLARIAAFRRSRA
jgi:two-component system chemotaxis sensor kinase CheA